MAFKMTQYENEGTSCSSEPSGAQLPHLLLHAGWTLKGQHDLYYCCHHQRHHWHKHQHHKHHHCHNQDQREKLQLREAAHYRYLTGGGSTVCEGRFQITIIIIIIMKMMNNVTGMTGRNLQQCVQP